MNWLTAIHDIAKYFLTGTYEKAFSLEGLESRKTLLAQRMEWESIVMAK